MRVILDTNVLLMALPSRSPYHLIIQKFNERDYDLILTPEIFLEYEEILNDKANAQVAANILSALIEAPNVVPVNIYYKWSLISADPDDNKFTDAYLSAGADYLVTVDAHFNEVKRLYFPRVNIVSPNEFLEIIKK